MAKFSREVRSRMMKLEREEGRLIRYRAIREVHVCAIDWHAMTGAQREDRVRMDDDIDLMLAEIHLELIHLQHVMSLDWEWLHDTGQGHDP